MILESIVIRKQSFYTKKAGILIPALFVMYNVKLILEIAQALSQSNP